jgi:hypothetical protein
MQIKKLLRAMREAGDGLPILANSSSGLGVRHRLNFEDPRFFDIHLDDRDHVHPNTGGMSVSPPPTSNIPERLRRNRTIFALETTVLHQHGLQFRRDPAKPDVHGFIEPLNVVHVSVYEQALLRTRVHWHKQGDDDDSVD